MRRDTYDEPPIRFDRGAWLGSPSGKVSIRRNETRELIIATREGKNLFAIQHLDPPADGRVTGRIEIPEAADVYIHLRTATGASYNKHIHLIFEKSWDNDAYIDIKSILEWKQDEVRMFINRLRGMFDEVIQFPTPLSAYAERRQVEIEWELTELSNEVEKFLSDRWDEAHKTKFRYARKITSRTDVPESLRDHLLANKNPRLSTKIFAKLSTLEAFQSELSGLIIKEQGLEGQSLINNV